MTEAVFAQPQLDALLEFIAGRGQWASFGAGMFTYPTGDAAQRLKHEMCLELERQGKIYRHLETAARVVWMPCVERAERWKK